MNKKNNLHVKTTRTERFSVSMALVATVAILTIGVFAAPRQCKNRNQKLSTEYEVISLMEGEIAE
jgi:anaerobic C4-dicarboxylate transporter